MTTPVRSRAADACLVAVFAVLISIPVIRWSIRALRHGTRLPAMTDLPTAIEADFPSRRGLTTTYNRLRRDGFGLLPRTVVRGRAGWLFYRSEAAEDGDTLGDAHGDARIDDATRERWTATLARRDARLAEAGIAYLVVLIPNKENTYPEFLPIAEQRHRAGIRRIDDVVEICAHSLRRPALDLRATLAEEKASTAVFHRLDTHWTHAGAFAGYEAIVRAIGDATGSPAAVTAPFARALFRSLGHPHEGDLARMAQLEPLTEPIAALVPTVASLARDGDGRALWTAGTPLAEATWPTGAARRLVTTGPPDAPRAVVFHDSFMASLAPLLAQHFSHAVFVWGHFDPALIAQEHPDVVIQESVERHLPRMVEGEAPGEVGR